MCLPGTSKQGVLAWHLQQCRACHSLSLFIFMAVALFTVDKAALQPNSMSPATGPITGRYTLQQGSCMHVTCHSISSQGCIADKLCKYK